MRCAVLITLFVITTIALGDDAPPGYLGVELEDAKPPQPAGSSIIRIAFDSGAEAAGLVAGDVILSVHDRPVKNVNELLLQTAKKRQSVGDRCPLRIWRNGKESDITVTLGQLGPERFLVQRNPPRVDGGTGTSRGGGNGEGSRLNMGGNYVVILEAGDPPHSMIGDYVQGKPALLSLKITGRPKHPIVHFSGAVQLAGILHVAFTRFTPQPGDAVEIFSDTKSISGKFDLLLLPTAPEGSNWEMEYDDISKGVDFDADGKWDVTLVLKRTAKDSK